MLLDWYDGVPHVVYVLSCLCDSNRTSYPVVLYGDGFWTQPLFPQIRVSKI